LEAPDFDGEPTPGKAEDYIYIAEEVRNGTPGEEAEKVTSLPPYTGARPIDDPILYAEYQDCPTVIISGAGDTIVSVYLKRKIYKLTFNLAAAGRTMEFKDGSGKYTGNEYSIDVKYEQDITDIWPSTSTVDFNFNFFAWATPSNVNESLRQWVTRRNEVTSDMMLKDPSEPGYTLTASTNVTSRFKVRYWFEPLPGQTGDTRQFGGKNYIIDRIYDQDSVPDLSAKGIVGMIIAGMDYSEQEDSPGNAVRGTNIYQHIYYNRTRHTLRFDMGIGNSIPAVAGLMFGEPLEDHKPADPTLTGYAFEGWYKDADCSEGE
jgi:hypothetical protein